MKKSMYYFLMALGGTSILSGVFLWYKGLDFKGYFYPFFIGVVLIGTSYINHQRKNKK